MHLKNHSNEYVAALGDSLFEKTPKTVFAALAVSLAMLRGDDDGNEFDPEAAAPFLLREWWALYRAGIIPQKPTLPEPEKKSEI